MQNFFINFEVLVLSNADQLRDDCFGVLNPQQHAPGIAGSKKIQKKIFRQHHSGILYCVFQFKDPHLKIEYLFDAQSKREKISGV